MERICYLDEVKLSQGPGIVRFIGTVEGKGSTIYYGIELIEKKGKNEGNFKNRQYFQCKPKHGLFVKIERILKIIKKSSKKNIKRLTINDEINIINKKCKGIIKYIGLYGISNEKLSTYYGIQLYKPIGNNNGIKNNIEYFKTKKNYGIFCKLKDISLYINEKSVKKKRKISNIDDDNKENISLKKKSSGVVNKSPKLRNVKTPKNGSVKSVKSVKSDDGKKNLSGKKGRVVKSPKNVGKGKLKKDKDKDDKVKHKSKKDKPNGAKGSKKRKQSTDKDESNKKKAKKEEKKRIKTISDKNDKKKNKIKKEIPNNDDNRILLISDDSDNEKNDTFNKEYNFDNNNNTNDNIPVKSRGSNDLETNKSKENNNNGIKNKSRTSIQIVNKSRSSVQIVNRNLNKSKQETKDDPTTMDNISEDDYFYENDDDIDDNNDDIIDIAKSPSITRQLINRLHDKKSSESNDKDSLGGLPNLNIMRHPSKSRGSVTAIPRDEQKKLKEFYKKTYGKDSLNTTTTSNNNNQHTITPMQRETNEDSENDEIITPNKYIRSKKRSSLGIAMNYMSQKEGVLKNGEKVCINDLIILKNNNEGYIKYIGEIQSLNNTIWYGIELIKGIGNNNGKLDNDNRIYFNTKKNNGIFVKLDDIKEVKSSHYENEDEQICYGDDVYVYDDRFKKGGAFGLVRFIGTLEDEKPSNKTNDHIYYGIELDKYCQDMGNGILNNIEYFKCEKGHGIFVDIDNIDLGENVDISPNDINFDNETPPKLLSRKSDEIGSLHSDDTKVTEIPNGLEMPSSYGNKSRSESIISNDEIGNYLTKSNKKKRRGSFEENKNDTTDEKVIENIICDNHKSPRQPSQSLDSVSMISVNPDTINFLTQATKKLTTLTTEEFDEWEQTQLHIIRKLQEKANELNEESDEELIDDDPDDNDIDIWEAAQFGYVKRLNKIISEHNKLNLNMVDRSEKTILMHAALQGKWRIVELLIEHGADVDFKKDTLNDTALAIAVKAQRLKCVRKLLAGKANPNSINGLFGWTPLHDAAFKNNYQIAQLLCEYGADVNIHDTTNAQKTPYDVYLETHKKETYDNPEDKMRDENMCALLQNKPIPNKIADVKHEPMNKQLQLTQEQVNQLQKIGIVSNFKGFDAKSGTMDLSKLSKKDINKLFENKTVSNILQKGIQSSKSIKKTIDVNKDKEIMKGLTKKNKIEYLNSLSKHSSNKKNKKKIDINVSKHSKNAKAKAQKIFENNIDKKSDSKKRSSGKKKKVKK